MGFFDKLKKGLEKTRQSFTEKIEQIIVGYAKIDDEFLDELEEALIMADVGVKTTDYLMKEIRKGIKSKEIKNPEDLKPFIQKQISEILGGTTVKEKITDDTPIVILVIGVNGVGKTTTIGKLGNYYKQEGKSVMFAAADTFRAAAIDQLEIWGNRVGVDVIKHTEGADPAAVAFDAVQSAKARKVDVLIIDTAGRLHTKYNLMEELKKVTRVIQREIPKAPHETLLVLDATTGQNAINQAQIFSKAAGISGLVLTKLDGTAKGGVVIGMKAELDIPVKWIGVGEGIDDLRPFDADSFAEALFIDK
ncbi:signal recognition particle-docking protein FtsY [Anaerosinus gibii]|uniref:Signal recognition particle receptor FtsY n=1 Tax=Selenobaculum gibii TaxID=3054208 RepID=A0A9Y2ET60_9FIRM|nr:signal recognition particle-docking protein FtsY [Selenobaculum gbiensis]WIW69590.1 signal recognition particle-docking protein FtsY [Selenobaculum gbiensis]